MAEDTGSTYAVELATEFTIAWLANPNITAFADDVPAVLQKMHQAVVALTSSPVEKTLAAAEYTPAVTARRSLASKNHIISLIDGKPYKALRRHLSGQGLTPEQYRERYNLKPDYPIVAESYSQVRREMAKRIGLGRKPGTKVAPKACKATQNSAPKPRGRPRKVPA